MKPKTKKFNFQSKQIHQRGGKKTIRNVTIKKDRGYKSIVYYDQNKMVAKASEKLKNGEVELIKFGKFIPGLFKNMRKKLTKKQKTRKTKKRGTRKR